MPNPLIWRLLRHHISPLQFAGFTLASFIGLTIIITALRLHSDIALILSPESTESASADHLIISKSLPLTGSLTDPEASQFTPDEISLLTTQPWVDTIGSFTPAAFSVAATIDLGSRPISTHLFLEGVDSLFLDVAPHQWSFDPAHHTEIPIIISRDYLTLYNLGFATSRSMPQISETMMSLIPMSLTLSGPYDRATIPARIVGFSSRLNTIAVPPQFISWANDRFAAAAPARPSRLIIRTNTPGHPDITRFLSDHDYITAGDKIDNSRATYLLTLLTSAIIAVGATITILALLILLLSLHLLIQKNITTLSRLMMLGYTPRQVATPYIILALSLLSLTLILSIAAMLLISPMWQSPLSVILPTHSSPLLPILIATAIIILLALLCVITITRATYRAFPSPAQQS